jgi:hypothetical protein
VTARAPLGEALAAGARLFDAGAFWEAHEAWEERWRIESGDAERSLLQGLIQVAASLHKLLVMGDPAAASRILARGLAKLDALPASPELAAAREALRACAAGIEAGQLGRERIPKLAAITAWLAR